MLDLVEGVFKFESSEYNGLRAAIKNGKTAQEVIEEYQPYKDLVAEIDKALAAATTAHIPQAEEGDSEDKAAKPEASAESGATFKTMYEEGVVLEDVEEAWLDYAQRIIGKHCVLICEKGLSQSQLQSSIEKYALSKVRGGAGGNVMLYFDCNNFGEAITAPHIRKCPLQSTVVKKLWKAVSNVRADPDSAGQLAPGDILVVVDGGRKGGAASQALVNQFGMGKDRKAFDKGRKEKDGKTVAREVILALEP